MEEVFNYLKECGAFYLATVEGGMPRVRPFGAVTIFEEKLYLVTNNKKKVFRQLLDNPWVEISGMNKDTWLRLEAKTVHDTNRAAREKMLADFDSLTKMYSVDDGLMEVFYLENATATIYSFSGEQKVNKF
jgi:uncharacterized pyridoxamine 5'-phosphate oxidase family protein